MSVLIPLRAALRAASRCELDVQSGCLISTYSRSPQGYAQVGWGKADEKRQGTGAHRAAWVYYTGEQIPPGMTVDHKCKVRPCVRFGHLRLLSNFENARRTNGRDWPVGECANGHPNSELRMTPTGLICVPCRREWQRKYRQKSRI